jgi:MoxR-like ATPase
LTVATPTPPFTLEASALAFRRFFEELREAFFERETLLTQIELALLCREHVLVTGPPGTAKSALANAVLGRIVDANTAAPSLFSKQVSEATVQTDLIGPVNFKTLTETGRTEYLTEDGMLGAIHAFLDEVFDGRDMLLRSILNVLHERELKHGRKVTAGKLECAVMTSNRYLSEAVSRAPELLLAFADRLSFICFVPKSFAREGSRAAMLRRATTGQRPELRETLTIQHLDTLQAAVEKVEVGSEVLEGLELLANELERALQDQVVKLPDYVPTKSYSQRSIVKALWALKAFVVRDRVFRSAHRPLTASIDDLAGLRHFFLLGGPPPEETEALLKGAVDPRERAQLEIIRLEHVAFDQAWQKARQALAGALDRESAALKLPDLRTAVDALGRSYQSELASQTAASLASRLVPGPRHPRNRAAVLSLAQTLLQIVQQRIGKGMAGQGEGNGGGALLTSLRDAIALSRRVPELAAFESALSAAAVRFCEQAVEMAALTAEGAEFDTQLKLDTLVALAERLDGELRAIRDLWGFVGNDGSPAATAFAKKDAEVRARVAGSLRRKAGALVQGGAKRADSFEALSASGRRIEQLEKALFAIDPAQAGVRQELLGPVALAYTRSALAQLQFQKIEQLAMTLRSIAEDVRREGLTPEPILQQTRDVLQSRLEGFAGSLAKAITAAAPIAARAISGEAYVDYRQAFAQTQVEGERAALDAIDAQLGAGGDRLLSDKLRDALAQTELASLVGRAQFLKGWLAQLLTSLPRAEAVRDRAQADQAFERLVKSRFPLLTMREGELLKLENALGALTTQPGQIGQHARAVQASVRAMTEQFSEYSKALLDARARS